VKTAPAGFAMINISTTVAGPCNHRLSRDLLSPSMCYSVQMATTRRTSTKRVGRTKTISISVDPVTEQILRTEAARYGGNVSRLIAAIALEARRQAAFERIMGAHPRMTDREVAEYWSGLESRRRKRRGASAA
jgi:hypothetical protein